MSCSAGGRAEREMRGELIVYNCHELQHTVYESRDEREEKFLVKQ
jgi:hypothetical protein